jgi:hypothetical protein
MSQVLRCSMPPNHALDTDASQRRLAAQRPGQRERYAHAEPH